MLSAISTNFMSQIYYFFTTIFIVLLPNNPEYPKPLTLLKKFIKDFRPIKISSLANNAY